MKYIILGVALICAPFFTANAHDGEVQEELQLKAFKSDQCTLSPNGWWGHCCREHDVSYWMGGTKADRKKADKRFKKCLKRVGGPDTLYWLGVQVGGGPEGPDAYRWGFGWSERLYYTPIEGELEEMVNERLDEWRQSADYLDFYQEYLEAQGREPIW